MPASSAGARRWAASPAPSPSTCRAGPYPSRRRQGRRGAHRVSHRRGARPHHRARARRSAGWSAMPTAPRSPTICGASAGRSSSPTRWATGCRPAPGCPARRSLQNEAIAALSGAARQRGDPRRPGAGLQLEEIEHLPPETIARAGEGDAAATEIADEQRLRGIGRACRRAAALDGPGHGEGPAHGDRIPQRLCRARRRKIGQPCRANAALTDIVTRVEKGELQPDPRHITDLRLN